MAHTASICLSKKTGAFTIATTRDLGRRKALASFSLSSSKPIHHTYSTTTLGSEPFPQEKTIDTAPKQEDAAPLSVMPNGMLLRSLLVSTISSHKFLLNPSLSFLSFLTTRNKGVLFNVQRNPVLHYILKKTFYDQFCAGENERQSKECIKQLKDMGMRGVMLTCAKETTFDHSTGSAHQTMESARTQSEQSDVRHDPDIESWRSATLETVDLIGNGDVLAMKTTGAGPSVTTAFTAQTPPPQQMLDALDEICARCKERGIRVVVDAESQHFQHGIAAATIDLMRKFNTDGTAVIFNTYQAYLKGTPDLLAQHLAQASKHGFTLGLKLVRGAYMAFDQRSLIHDTKADTDRTYDSIALGALRQQLGEYGTSLPFPSVNLFLASHNQGSVLAAHRLHQQRRAEDLPTVPVCFAQLHGMSDVVSFALLQEKSDKLGGPEVYKCSTWGSLSECMAYLLRRAVENKDAVSRTGDELRALRKELRRRLTAGFTTPRARAA